MKVRLAVIVGGVLLAGGVGMAGQAPWVVEVQAYPDRTDASGGYWDNKNASGLGSYHYHCGGYPTRLYPDGVCPYVGGGESIRTKIQIQAKVQTQVQIQVQARARAAIREISGIGEASGTSGWCRNGAQWNYICGDGAQLIGCWKRIGGIRYCFDDDGDMRTGRHGENGSFYYLGTDEEMAVGTCVIDGKGYQFDQDGKMTQSDSR